MADDSWEDDSWEDENRETSWITDPMLRSAMTDRPLVATVVHLVPAGMGSEHRIFVNMEVHVPKKCFPKPFSEHQDSDLDMAEWDEYYARMNATVCGFVRGMYGPAAFVRDAEETPANEDDFFIGAEVRLNKEGQEVVLARLEVEEIDMSDPKGVDRHNMLRDSNFAAQLQEEDRVRREWIRRNPDI